MTRRAWMGPTIPVSRTPSTGRLSARSREALELRWAAAVADPAAWWATQLAAAALATNRSIEDVRRAWGLA